MTIEPRVYSLPGLWAGRTPSIAEWGARRREMLDAFARHVYGRSPEGGGVAEVVLRSRREDALDGTAIRIEAELVLRGPKGDRATNILIYAPLGARAVPAFLGLNFQGNHTTTEESDVAISPSAHRIAAAHGDPLPEHGAQAERWPLRKILKRGFAVVTMWYEELEIDLPGFEAEGVRGLFDQADDEPWGAIGAWAWGLSRVLDVLATFREIDETRVVAVGHSRLGKTALWASAQDERFAAVVSNESGCGGASLFRHRGVEDIDLITSVRPHWFTPGFAEYRNRDESLPVDQHQLLALQAPRPTHVGSASEDSGADPYGEFLSTLHASPVFELFGHRGPMSPSARGVRGEDVPSEVALAEPCPEFDRRIGEQLSYHIREGAHGMWESDWRHVLDFADGAVLGACRFRDGPVEPEKACNGLHGRL